MSGTGGTSQVKVPCTMSMPMPLDGTTHSGGHVDINTIISASQVNFDARMAEKLFARSIAFDGLLPEPPLQPPQNS